jgi:hypothetical protein
MTQSEPSVSQPCDSHVGVLQACTNATNAPIVATAHFKTRMFAPFQLLTQNEGAAKP